jgi:magnesium transporter
MIVDCAVYEAGRRRPGDLPILNACEASRRDDAFVWIGLYEPTQDEFDSVRREFDLHELAVEDAINAHQRPKLEAFGDSLLVVLKPARYRDDQVELGEILIFLGEDFIITVRHGEAPLHDVRVHTEQRPELLECGPGAALYAIVDWKRQVLELHAAVVPLAEPLDRLARGRQELIAEDLRAYFRDVHDHLLRVIDRIEGCRDLLTSVLAANMTQVTVRQNEDMRKISAWGAIIIAPAVITGIYGMNFRHMPELKWSFGYPLAIGVILLICFALYRYFRRIGWL